MSNITMHQLQLDFKRYAKNTPVKIMREEKTGNVRLVTKCDCWELISQNKDTRKKGKEMIRQRIA